MLIVIPTYRRNGTLKWVLRSLVHCWTQRISEPIRVLVVNNFPPAKEEITSIVSEFLSEKRFEWNIFCRKQTLPPVENWYSVISDRALPHEIILLQGDDDIFCPWSLEDRYLAISEQNAEMLLSRSVGRLLFLPDESMAVFRYEALPRRQIVWTVPNVAWADINEWGPAFIGNHCYRHNEAWRNAFRVAIEWCECQHWLDPNTRTLMLPFYLPFAIKYLGGRLAGLDEVCVIRGGDLSEMRKSVYGSPGWNSGFLALCAYGVLASGPLGARADLDRTRQSLLRMASRWFLTFHFDHRISRHILQETLCQIKPPWTISSWVDALLGVRLLFGQVLGLRGWATSLRARHSAISVDEILVRLSRLAAE